MLISTDSNSTNHLTLPLDPARHPEIERGIYPSEGIPPQAFELVGAVAARTASMWENPTNEKITQLYVNRHRFLPFTDIEFFLEPTSVPGYALTVLKLGVAYCWILEKILDLSYWPGRITTIIYDADPRGGQLITNVGTLRIVNSPLHDPDDLSPTNSSKHQPIPDFSLPNNTSFDVVAPLQSVETISTNLQPAVAISLAVAGPLPPDLERRWLRCWTKVYFRAMTKGADETLRENIGPTPMGPGGKLWRYQCNQAHNNDFIDVRLEPIQGGQPPTTIKHWVVAMLTLVGAIARNPNLWAREVVYKAPSDEIGVRIVLDGVPRALKSSG